MTHAAIITSSRRHMRPDVVSPGGLYPNEPVGFTRFAEYDFTTVLNHGVGNSNGQEVDGCAWKFSSGNLLLASDPTAPQSPPGVTDFKFPTGLVGGTGVGFYQMWDTCSETSNTEYSKVYSSTQVKLVGTDWEGNPGSTKWLGFWGFGEGAQVQPPTQLTGNMFPGGIRTNFTMQFTQQNVLSRNMNQNRNTSVKIQAGVWLQIEVLMEINSAVDVADGTLRAWQNGTLIVEYTDVIWRTTTDPSLFYGRRYDPLWGGGPGLKTRDDHIYIDHEYISGVP